MSYVFLFIGVAGSGKTTCALSGEDKTSYHEFDPGSYDRAVKGLPVDESNILLHRHWAPLTSLKSLGKVSASGLGMQMKHLEGWTEAYSDFVDQYLEDLQKPEVHQAVFDTETNQWLMIRQGWQQQIQNAGSKAEADRMSPLVYTEPNARYEQIVTASKMYGKDLILIGHMKEDYKNDKPTGVMIHDGHREAPNLCDLFLEFGIENKKPVATIRKAGAGGLELVGMKLVAPTLKDLRDLLDSASLIRKMGGSLPSPLTLEALRDQARVFQQALA